MLGSIEIAPLLIFSVWTVLAVGCIMSIFAIALSLVVYYSCISKKSQRNRIIMDDDWEANAMPSKRKSINMKRISSQISSVETFKLSGPSKPVVP